MKQRRDPSGAFYHKQQLTKSNQYLGYWIKRVNLSLTDIDTHPYIDDLVLLINIRTELWRSMTASEQSYWGAIWNFVKNKKYPLNQKYLKRFESITLDILERQQRIQQLRLNTDTKSQTNNTIQFQSLKAHSTTSQIQQQIQKIKISG